MAFMRDFQWASYDNCCEMQKPTPSAELDIDMDISQDFDNYSESIASSSSFPFSSTSGSTGTTDTSSFASDVGRPIRSEQTPGSLATEDFAAPQQGQFHARGHGCGVVEGCIDPRLVVQGSLSSEHREAPERRRWGGRDQTSYDEKVIQKPDVGASLPPFQDARQHATNEFDIAFEEMHFTKTEPDLGTRMWLRTWIVTNPNRFPNKVEQESLKTLSGLSESEITAWLGQHISVPIVPEVESIVIDAEHTPRQNCTPLYRPKCCKSQRRFRYITETRDETRVLQCTHRCGQSFDVTGQWTRHERYNIEEWRCHECRFMSPRKDKLLKHLRQHHSFRGAIRKSHCRQLLQPEVRPCGFCLRQFDNWSEWLNHVAAHFQGRIPGGPWTMARWNKAVDKSFNLSDNEDDDDDDDDDDDQGHDDEGESNPDYESSAADNRSSSSTKGKGAPSGGGSKGSFGSLGSSRSGPAGARNSRSCKKAGGESLHQEHDYRTIESEDSYPFRNPDDEGGYNEHKSSEHFTPATDDGSTFVILRTGLTSVTLDDSSGWNFQPMPENEPREDAGIAIVGVSGRLRDSVSHELARVDLSPVIFPEYPKTADRFPAEPRTHSATKRKGVSHPPCDNFIQNPGLFQARFFNKPSREVVEMDLTPSLLLETAGEALDLGSILSKDKDSERLVNEKDRPASCLSELAQAFIMIPYGHYDACQDFMAKYSTILKENLDDFQREALRLQRKGRTQQFKSCVQQLLLMRRISKMSGNEAQVFFKKLRDNDSTTLRAFLIGFDKTLAALQAIIEVIPRNPTQCVEKKSEPQLSSPPNSGQGQVPANQRHAPEQARRPVADDGLSTSMKRVTLSNHNWHDSAPAYAAGADNARLPPVSYRPASGRRRSHCFIPDYRHRVRDDCGKFFKIGRVFAMLWHEGAGDPKGGHLSNKEHFRLYKGQGRYGEKVYSHILRMAVVRVRHGYCLCIPIHSYNDRGLSKPGFNRQDQEAHAIIHMDDTEPGSSIPGERKLTTASRYYRNGYCLFKTKREPECKQHMEKKDRWRWDYMQESSNIFGKPEETLHRSSIHHLRSRESSTCSNMERSRSTLKVTRPTTKHQKIKLLFLDGGGVRGLSSLILLERLTSIANQQANGREPVLDPSDLFSTVVGTSTGGVLASKIRKLTCAKTDVRQPLVPKASPGSEDALISPVLKQFIDLADTLRHLQDICDEGPRPAADLMDLSHSDKLQLSGWHQDIKPQNIVIFCERPEIFLQRPAIIDPDTPACLDQLVWEAASAIPWSVYYVEENRRLDDVSEPSTYLDWMPNWWREHNMGLRHYVRHGMWPVEDDGVIDDAGGGKVDLIDANISDLNPRDLKSMVLSTELLSTQSTGLPSLIRQNGDTSRSTSQRPQSNTTFCSLCKNHPQGFRGEHELRRHVNRHHPMHRKVWISTDHTASGGACPTIPLCTFKACRNQKTHGANYNAAAHLRRAHFYPCKNKRGGRGKVSEGRGGKGGGNEPPMGELKNRMWEKVEVNVTSVEGTAPEVTHFDPHKNNTGASPPKVNSPPTFDTIRKLHSDEQNPAQFARYKIERFLNERDDEDCAWRSAVENGAVDADLQDTSPGAVLGANGEMFLDDDRDGHIATHQETRRPPTTSADSYIDEGFASSLGILGGSRRGRKKQRQEEPSKWPI